MSTPVAAFYVLVLLYGAHVVAAALTGRLYDTAPGPTSLAVRQ